MSPVMGKRGPKPNPAGWRSKRLDIRVSEAERDTLRQAAKKLGITVAELVRKAALRKAALTVSER